MRKLKEQHERVRHNALEVERSRLALAGAQARLSRTVRRQLTSPRGLFLAFTAGVLWGLTRPSVRPQRARRQAQRVMMVGGWLAKLLRYFERPVTPSLN